jgi:aspartyl-tRNA(Asn)/glutamyl-tRNA(Gln) amidotransferase subunit A
MLDELDPVVTQTFERALDRLTSAGAMIEWIAVPEFAEVRTLNAKGGFSAAESWAWHRALIATKADLYDPRVISRIWRGESLSAADYVDLLAMRRAMIAGFERRVAPYDALIAPTVAITPPVIADLADDAAYTRANMLSLRNCTLINTIDGCAISLPCHREGDAPVGLMLAAAGGSDRRIFELAAGIEPMIRG